MRLPPALAQAFPIDHEEEPVFAVNDSWHDNRSAHGEAVLISLEWRDRVAGPVEVVLGIESRIAQELEGTSVKVIGPRASCRVDLRDSPAVFGVEQTRLDLEFLQRVDRRLDHIGIEVGVGVVDAIQREIIEVASIASDGDILIGIDGELLPGGSYTFKSLAGDMSIRIPADSSFSLVANGQPQSINLNTFASPGLSFVGDGRKVYGNVGRGEGRATLTILNQRGTITLLSH